jgi:hypothetical protein
VARRLGLDPAAAAEELAQVRALFRDRCHRNHLDTPMDANCRSYARLLDAVTRSPGAETPEDLSWHLSRCVECAEAAACLRLHGGGLPSALASGVIGWGGLAYLERRRRAADAGLLGGRRDVSTDTGITESRLAVPRIGRTALLVTAVVVSALALTVSLMPFDSAAGGGTTTAGGESGNELPAVDPGTVLPSATARPSSASASPDPSESPRASGTTPNPDTEAQGKPSSAADVTQKAAEPTKSAAPTCEVRYRIDSQWEDGFQATVTVTSTEALATWRVSWTFDDGQSVTQMWDGTFSQQDSRVTATAADYNRTVAAGAAFTVGFLGSWQGANSVPDDFTLNGANCTRES